MLGPKELSDLISEQVAMDQVLNNGQVILCRYDGVVLYATDSQHQEIDLSSIGVLISGSWQAARSLVDFIPERNSDDFRFSFDTSDSGVFVVDIFIGGHTYFLAAVFNNVLNPGQIKSKLRSLVFLIHQLAENYQREKNDKPIKPKENEESLLFEDLTDDEIDRMFSFAGI